jgi:short subunit dehydrogenase-like uncharacterized protein
MSSTPRAMIYGANGYTGRLIARHAVERGLKPVLAGRNREAIATLAAELGCEAVDFELQQPAQIADHLRGISAVLHCAGPFSQTARPMMDACLLAQADYLDITGEIDVILAAVSRGDRAKQAGVALIPAVGFDVVPSDCLAAMLSDRLPAARVLQLAFSGAGGLSAGTAKTMVEALPGGGRVRIDGEIRHVPIAWKTLEIPFRHGKQWGMTIPWGDVASAYYSTGIANIEVYATAPRAHTDRTAAAAEIFAAAVGLEAAPVPRETPNREARSGALRRRPQEYAFVVVGSGQRRSWQIGRGDAANAWRLPTHRVDRRGCPGADAGAPSAARFFDRLASVRQGIYFEFPRNGRLLGIAGCTKKPPAGLQTGARQRARRSQHASACLSPGRGRFVRKQPDLRGGRERVVFRNSSRGWVGMGSKRSRAQDRRAPGDRQTA